MVLVQAITFDPGPQQLPAEGMLAEGMEAHSGTEEVYIWDPEMDGFSGLPTEASAGTSRPAAFAGTRSEKCLYLCLFCRKDTLELMLLA